MRIGLLQVCDQDRDTIKLFGPLSLAYLSSYLRQYGGYEDVFIERDLKKLLDKKPDLIGISSYTETFLESTRISGIIKEQADIPVILGGHHITGIPETLPSSIDAGVIGEGEETFFELVQMLEKEKAANCDFSKINGIVYHNRDTGSVTLTPKKKEPVNIDLIPIPDRKKLDHLSPHFQLLMHTSRGCPFTCSFCSVFSRKVRFHSAQRVVEELLQIRRDYPEQRFVHISDDIFAFKNKRFYDLVELIKAEKLNKQFTFTCHARANIFDEELAFLLREMNVKYVSFGFESGSESIVKEVKGKFNIRDNWKVLNICEKYNLKVCGYLIGGYPMETKEDFAKTYWFLSSNRDRIFRSSLTQLTPLPGTDMWDYGVKTGVVNGKETNWEKLDFGYNETNENIFFNEHYSYDFFQENFKKLRDLQEDLRRINTGELVKYNFLGKRNVPGKEGHNSYINGVYSRLKDFIPVNSSVLEVASNNHGFEKFLDESVKFTMAFETLPENEEYDFIFLNHSLEASYEPEKFLSEVKQMLKPDGKIILLFYNTQYYEIILQLINGDWSNLQYGLTQFKNLNYFSSHRIKALLNKSGLQVINDFEFDLISEKYDEKILKVLSGFATFDDNHLKAYSYLLVCTK